jgi:hypothetical protein
MRILRVFYLSRRKPMHMGIDEVCVPSYWAHISLNGKIHFLLYSHSEDVTNQETKWAKRCLLWNLRP